jgi:hypothetical protein
MALVTTSRVGEAGGESLGVDGSHSRVRKGIKLLKKNLRKGTSDCPRTNCIQKNINYYCELKWLREVTFLDSVLERQREGRWRGQL